MAWPPGRHSRLRGTTPCRSCGFLVVCCMINSAYAAVTGTLQANCGAQGQCNPTLTLLLTAAITQTDDTASYEVPSGPMLSHSAPKVCAHKLTARCTSAGTYFQDEESRSWEVVDDLTLDLTPAINGGVATLPSDSGAPAACRLLADYDHELAWLPCTAVVQCTT